MLANTPASANLASLLAIAFVGFAKCACVCACRVVCAVFVKIFILISLFCKISAKCTQNCNQNYKNLALLFMILIFCLR